MQLASHLKNSATGAAKLRDRLHDQLVQKDVLAGQVRYTKFVVLGWYRTGSNFLITTLNAHPQAVAFSEIFSPKKIFWSNGVYGKRDEVPGLLERREEDAQRFIEEHVYRLYAPKVKAVGFKVFYPQLEDPAYGNLLRYVRSDSAIRIVHLQRSNQLRVLLSTKIAMRTGARTETSRARAEAQMKDVPEIVLTYEECLKHFIIVSSYVNKYENVLRGQGRSVLDVEYETLVADPRSGFQRIQTFLGLEPRALSSPLVKQNRRPIADLVENYGELKRRFAGSPWAVYFDE